MKLADTLVQILDLYQMTSYELAKKLGVTLATMSRALNNKTDVGYNEVND
jgi:plasmid maintenance system antidote protein VapI